MIYLKKFDNIQYLPVPQRYEDIMFCMSARLRVKAIILPILVAALILLQTFNPTKIWTGLLVGLGGLLALALLWSVALARGLFLTREMRFGWVQVGDRMEERLSIENTALLPAAWLEVMDTSTLPGYQVSRVTTIGGQETIEWRTEGVCSRRGVYTIGPTSLRTGDPFGIFEVHLDDPARASLLVMPPIVPLPEIRITPGGYFGDGRPRPNALEQTVNASSVREYAPGDGMRTIHWPTTARRGEPYVRLFDGSPSGDWWIVLDLQQEAQIGEGWDSSVELGIVLAASLSDRIQRARQAVGVVIGGRTLTWIPPRHSEGQRLEILRALALAEPGQAPLRELLERVRPSIGRRASLITITPCTNPEWLAPIALFQRTGCVPTALLIDPTSFGDERSMDGISDQLGRSGITRHVMTRDLLDRAEMRPGARGQWQWRTTGTGKAIAVQLPGDMTWKRLGKDS
jgi:uncharacterized protein (DUF58 family)